MYVYERSVGFQQNRWIKALMEQKVFIFIARNNKMCRATNIDGT